MRRLNSPGVFQARSRCTSSTGYWMQSERNSHPPLLLLLPGSIPDRWRFYFAALIRHERPAALAIQKLADLAHEVSRSERLLNKGDVRARNSVVLDHLFGIAGHEQHLKVWNGFGGAQRERSARN